MLVISDASPINVLIRIDLIHILPSLYQRVVIPCDVRDELSDPAAPEAVRAFVKNPPAWLEIRQPVSLLLLFGLGKGEVAAISLAHEVKSPLLLVDDRRGRRAAQRLGIPIVGTLGILEQAANQKLVEFRSTISRLRTTDFKIAEKLIEDAIKRVKPDA
jgi:predicted nucleic acid-binding protein